MSERAERIRCCGNALGESPMDGFLPMDDDSAAARARRFREKAEEIRRAARLANSLDIVRELLETAFHFDNMAARVEKSLLTA